jgi:hypothetical protein
MSHIPDRSRHDDDIAQSLSILGAAGNAALIERNYLLTEENESLLDGAAKRQAYVEEIEARCRTQNTVIHTQAQEIAALRQFVPVNERLLQENARLLALLGQRHAPLDRIKRRGLNMATRLWGAL